MKIRITKDNFWIRFGDKYQTSSFTSGFSGKYLIFSKNQRLLLNICKDEIKNHVFEAAKVSVSPRNQEYVCCLYWHDDKRKHELAKRHGANSKLKYRYWKSNADTRAGIYSKQFLAGEDVVELDYT